MTTLHVSDGAEPVAISLSTVNGVAVRSTAFGGRVLKGLIEAAPIGHGAALECTAAAISADGAHVAWGMINGEVRVSLVPKAIGGPAPTRHSAPTRLGSHQDQASVAVLSFADAPGIFATCAVTDGVKIWRAPDPKHPQPASELCLWSLGHPIADERGVADLPTAIACSYAAASALVSDHRPARASVVIGTASGYVHAFLDIDLSVGKAASTSTVRLGDAAVSKVVIDVRDATPSVLALSVGASTFERLNFGAAQTIKYGVADAAEFGPITALAVEWADLPTADRTGLDAFGTSPFVVVGDALGRVQIFPWDAEPDAHGLVGSRAQLQSAGSAIKVTALAITELLVFVGGLDGVVRAYDPLTPALGPVRLFRERSAGRHAARVLGAGQATAEQEQRYAVLQITATRSQVVASVGQKLIAWRIGEGAASALNKERGKCASVHRAQM